MTTERRPEILAPAGGPAQLEAALHAGADAVYFGLDRGFNARARATGFTPDRLAETMDLIHAHGRRGYLALNTLVFDEELTEVERRIRHAARCGVDALIVQDIGVARLARAAAPHLPLHASTQMSITDAEGARFARSLGMRRVVVGRELSIDEIAAIVGAVDIELEAFVHGALCVSYSGQCFSSEAWGGRSANRGQCAQACRLPYGLLVDGALHRQGDLDYLLSPQDLMALPLLPRLIRAGVRSLKIEGRLKGPEYVHRTVSAYREALDHAWERFQAGETPDTLPVAPATRRALAQVFSRGQDAEHDGLTPGFLEGPRHQSLVIGRNPRHRGLHLGQVLEVLPDGIRLRLHNPVKPGDGVVFDQGRPQQREIGGNVFAIERDGRRVREEIDQGEVVLRFGRGFRADAVRPGDHLWRTRDAASDGGPNLDLRTAWRLPVRLHLGGRAGEPLRLTLSTEDGRQGRAESATPLAPARQRALDAQTLRQTIGSLGDTPFRIADLTIDLEEGLFLPLGEIKRARREAVAALTAALQRHDRDREMPAAPVLPRLLPETGPPHRADAPRLTVLCRSAEQVDAALALSEVDELVVDFLEVHGLKTACERIRRAGRRLVVAAPRIFKPGEERLARYLLRLAPDALLVRSTGLLWALHRAGGPGAPHLDATIPALQGDFSLNAANRLAAMQLLDLGLERLAPTHDLNAAQLAALAVGLDAERRARIEVIAHQHLPIFHTEHCVFARFLSDGDSWRDCGRPCEAHRVHLRDPKGKDHLLLADVGCRNTLFNAQAQSAARHLEALSTAGITHYRIELVDEPADEVGPIVEGYRALLAGERTPGELLARLARVADANRNRQGVGPGSLAVRVEPPRTRMKTPTAR